MAAVAPPSFTTGCRLVVSFHFIWRLISTLVILFLLIVNINISLYLLVRERERERRLTSSNLKLDYFIYLFIYFTILRGICMTVCMTFESSLLPWPWGPQKKIMNFWIYIFSVQKLKKKSINKLPTVVWLKSKKNVHWICRRLSSHDHINQLLDLSLVLLHCCMYLSHGIIYLIILPPKQE